MNRAWALLLCCAGCDDACARLVYVDLYGPDATTRTVIVNAQACPEEQVGLQLAVGPSLDPEQAVTVGLPVIPAGACWQVGHPDAQWGTEFTPTKYGSAEPWPEFAVALIAEGQVVDAVWTSWLTRQNITAPLRRDEAGGWHEVASFGGDCSLFPAP